MIKIRAFLGHFSLQVKELTMNLPKYIYNTLSTTKKMEMSFRVLKNLNISLHSNHNITELDTQLSEFIKYQAMINSFINYYQHEQT